MPADVIVVGIGVAPAIEWLEGSGLTLRDGVVCDGTLNAGAPGIYAAGDVARWPNALFGEEMRVEHWTNASEQGAVAARNLLVAAEGGVPEPYAPVPFFWSDQVPHRIQFLGRSSGDEPGDEVRVVHGALGRAQGARPLRPAWPALGGPRRERAAAGDAVQQAPGDRRELGRRAGLQCDEGNLSRLASGSELIDSLRCMSDATSFVDPTGTAERTVRLPLAELPATVLPGAVITLGLATDQLRRAIEGVQGTPDKRLLLRAGDDQLAVVAQVPDIGSLPTGEPVAIVRVESRARIAAVHTSERGATYADAEILRDPRPTPRVEALARELRVVLEEIAQLRRSRRLPELLRTAADPGALADGVVTWADLDEEERREVLAAVAVADRVELILTWARNHLAELQVAESIRNDVTEGVDKQQREYLLRQQLAAIRKELGEGDDDVVGEYRTRLASLDVPEAAHNFIAKEIDRLERTSAQSPEQGWIRTWLDRVFELPWGVRSDDTIDLTAAQEILDADHYGLADVKSRIVEFLAVRKLRNERESSAAREAPATSRSRGSEFRATEAIAAHGAIVTLVGPPGVGKTRSASRSPGPWAASSCASPSAACATRPRSAATGAPTSGRSRAASSRRSPRPAR